MSQPPVIIISRTDSIGDVVLTLPMAGVIKQQFPDARIIFLGKNYTTPIIALSQYVDEIWNDDTFLNLSDKEQIQKITKAQVTHIIHVFPNKHIASIAKKAGIKNRIGTRNRWWHWFTCNKLIKLSRKNSSLHEAQLNIKLLSPLGINTTIELTEISNYYGFTKLPLLPSHLQALISSDKKNRILHPKSKGSAREWGEENFSQYITSINKERNKIFICGTKEEGLQIKQLITQHPEAIDLTGKLSLTEYIAFINACDTLIAASTGPLHIAAALGIQAIGLFAPMVPIHPQRWAPIGKKATHLVLNKTCNDCREQATCQCIKDITPASLLNITNQ